ncbi:hypothetical protein LFZ50_03510 [Salmonella enterica subsp. arizonae serovar 53:-:- str. SA20100345]|nr:hypothetical protein LFZ50_03510 [Salmonella enterica subsp. arizonae serovar 53:-:- str. SA20100345]
MRTIFSVIGMEGRVSVSWTTMAMNFCRQVLEMIILLQQEPGGHFLLTVLHAAILYILSFLFSEGDCK